MTTRFRIHLLTSVIACVVLRSGLFAVTPTGRPVTGGMSRLTEGVRVHTQVNTSLTRSTSTVAREATKARQATGGIAGYSEGINGPGSQPSSSGWLTLSQSTVEIQRGQSASLGVTLHTSANGPNYAMIVSNAGQVHHIHAHKAVSEPLTISPGEEQLRNIRVDANAPLGTYHIDFTATWSGEHSATNATLTVQVVAAPQVPQVENIAVVEAFAHPLNVDYSMLNNGFQTVASMFAVCDVNFDGVVNSANGDPEMTFPSFPDALGNPISGKGYASVNGHHANIVVYIGLAGDSQCAVLHLKDDGFGNVTPVQLIVLDFLTGEIMLQDTSDWDYDFDATWPIGGNSGSVSGHLVASPFGYNPDPDVNLIYGNGMEINFSMELTANE